MNLFRLARGEYAADWPAKRRGLQFVRANKRPGTKSVDPKSCVHFEPADAWGDYLSACERQGIKATLTRPAFDALCCTPSVHVPCGDFIYMGPIAHARLVGS